MLGSRSIRRCRSFAAPGLNKSSHRSCETTPRIPSTRTPTTNSLLKIICRVGPARFERRPTKKRVHPMFWGDSNKGDEVRRFHPEGMSAISRGLSVRDTPGTTAQKGDWHPEGMLASSECLPSSRGSHPFRMKTGLRRSSLPNESPQNIR